MIQDQKHIALAVAAFFGVLGFGTMILVWPVWSNTKELRAEIKGLEAKMNALDAVTEQTTLLSEELHDARTYLAQDLKRIPDAPNIADLMRRLSLRVDGVTVWDQTFTAGSQHAPLGVKREGEADDAPDIRAMPLNIDMQATFDSVFALLQSAESMDRLVRIVSLRLHADRERLNRDGEPMLVATVGLDAIYETAAGEQP